MISVEGNFDNTKVNNLLKKHFIELRSVSPAGSTHVLDVEGLKDPSIKFWSLWENEKLIGCGALKFLDSQHGEFKSIRVADEFRKKGFGEKIIFHLIEEAKKLKIKKDVCINSLFNGITITINMLNDNPDKIRLFALRSFGESLYHSITDASLEFGYEVI